MKGDDIHPFYKSLTSKEASGKNAGDIRWNFDKFLLDRSGKVIARFEPKVDPMAKEFTTLLEGALKAPAPKA